MQNTDESIVAKDAIDSKRAPMPDTPLRILVVDDDADACVFFHKVFKKQGWHTEFAIDGLSAISQARKWKPDLIVLDLGLPAGDGFTVMQRLKSNITFTLIPIIVISSRSASSSESRVLAVGAKMFVQKPVDADRLVALVHDVMELRSGGASAG
jgi:DNA-binding response OmpR family regulator